MTEHSKDAPRPSRGPREPRPRRDAEARRPLRDIVCEVDRDILRLLLRRHNILARMRGTKRRLDPAEEKILRESWEAAVSRISRDARLSGHFFSLMQEVEFQPRPVAPGGDGEAEDALSPHEPPRTAFNLAPPQKPVRLRMAAPLACRATRAWLMLAAATGQPLHCTPCLMNDPLVDCVKMLNQAGASLTREDTGVVARPAAPLGAPDKVIHVGDSAWNFFMLLGHYLGRPSRAKFTGEADLKLADLSAVRHFLPALGARLVHIVPKSEGLPARLECSGILPESVRLPHDVPPELAEGLLLAAPGYAQGLTLDLTAHPEQELILARTLPLLRAACAAVSVDKGRVRVQPGPLRLPATPQVALEPTLALFLLALPLALGGEVRLDGLWPDLPQPQAGWRLLAGLGLDLKRETRPEDAFVSACCTAPLRQFSLATLPTDFPPRWTPLVLALAACAALRGHEARLPLLPPCTDQGEAESFLHAAGLELGENKSVRKAAPNGPRPAWNAPGPVWAMALALAACASPHQRLGNPGVMTGLYPAFWALYNTLPQPAPRRATPEEAPTPPARRRIITAAVAVPPEIREDEEQP